jgi:hypothetical protein
VYPLRGGSSSFFLKKAILVRVQVGLTTGIAPACDTLALNGARLVPSLTKVLILTLLLASNGMAYGQSAAAPQPSQLSPQAAYDQVMRPLTITRRSIANWSDSETNALAIAVQVAATECSARTPEQFNGDDLIAYAQLCSLGQKWPTVGAAATRYIESADPAKPQLTQAYAYQVGAALHTGDPKAILASSIAMLHAVPYNSITDETMYGALHYLQLAYPLDAFNLYVEREPLLLAALRAPQPPAVTPDTTVPIHTLYADGVAFAAHEQFRNEMRGASGIISDLDAALPQTLQPDDSIPIAGARRQYALLGTHLPHIPLTVSLYSVGETPRINTNYGAATVLFLFPDWCAQCIRMTKQLLPTLYRVSESQIHLYALLAGATPPVTAAPKPGVRPKPSMPAIKPSSEPQPPETPQTPAEQLRGTPTLIVPSQTLAQFAATDFPLLIATDPKGIIRFIQPANETALNPGDFLDQITAHIVQQWPQATSAAASPTAPAKP